MREEGLSSDLEDLVTHFVVACNVKASATADKSMQYGEVLIAAVICFLRLWGVTS